MKKYYIPLFLGALFLPLIAHADVKIHEVAWMGTEASQYSEWIELYNDGEEPLSLKDWRLTVNGNEMLYTLSKSIDAKGYLLVERTTASAPDAVPGIADEAGTFGSGGLSNAGENLALQDSTGAAVDTLSYASGWPAGDAETKDTMQWNGEKWITAPGTPGKENAAQTVAVETSEPASDSAESTAEKSSAGSSKAVKLVGPKPITKSKITVVAPKNIIKGGDAEFDATIVLADAIRNTPGYYYWNMGDGTTYVQQAFAPVAHAYHYPGTYTVTLAYYNSPVASKPSVQGTESAIVSEPVIALEAMENGNAVRITNTSSKPIDIGQWPLSTTGGVGRLPPLTVLAAKAEIIVAAQSLGLASIDNPVLNTPDGAAVQKGSAKKKK